MRRVWNIKAEHLFWISWSLRTGIPKERRSELDETDRMQYAEIQIFFCYSSLVPFWVQIPCLHENLNSEGYEGSAILWAKRAAKQRRASKTRFCEWRGWTVTISGKAQEFLWITGCQFLFFPLYFSGHSLCGLWGHKSTKQSDINTQNSESTERTIWVF